MEIRFYDSDLNFLGLTENQVSLQWNRSYFGPGSFELHLPITTYNISLCKLGNLVTYRNAVEAGVIENILMNDKETTGVELVVKGRFLSSYMDRRLIRPRVNFSGKVEVAMRQLLSNAVPLPHVQLGTLNGYTDTIKFQATYKNLLAYEIKLAQYANYGFRFKPNFTNKTITFEIYQGLDRSRGQGERAFVEFSDEFDNLQEVSYHQNDQLRKNVGYVGGQGQDEERVFVVVGDDSLQGLERREVYIDARDLSPEGITSEDYEAVLAQRGVNKMQDDALYLSLDCSTDANLNFVYKRDYNLGDIVTVRKNLWGVSYNLRIVELYEIYEKGKLKVVPVLGTPLPTAIDWEDN